MSLLNSSAADLLARLRSGELSAETLMAQVLDRIGAVNGTVNAIVALRDGDELMAEARAADAARDKGPLHGLPMAVKDLEHLRGVVCSSGSPLFRDFVPQQDGLLASRLRAAGAILIGKTNVPEFGLGSHTFNPVYGPTRNPYDTTRSSGGSSGGAAAALAAGMLALADGSDMMGSLRNPAAWNNVYGFRPSWGRVPADPAGDMFLHQLSTNGPMARSPEDIALLLDVISGPDPRRPLQAPAQPVAPLTPANPAGLRIGWLGDWGGALPMEAGILDNARAALAVLADLGCVIAEVAPPFEAGALWDSWTTLRSFAMAGRHAPLLDRRDQLKDSAIWEIERGCALSAMEVHRASLVRSDWFRTAAALFRDYDALVLPSAQLWPFDVTLDHPAEIAGQAMDTYHRWMEVVVPVSLIGLPALAMPAGFSAGGLPGGVQLFGPLCSDAALLALGAAYHAATGWPQQRPPAL